MTVCKARWERGVWLCGGSKSDPDPCVLHGCGELSIVDPQGNVLTTFRGPCRCPVPAEDPDPPAREESKGED